MVPWRDAAVAFWSYQLLRRIESDPDGFIMQFFPKALQSKLRWHVKGPADFIVDTLLAIASPLVPRNLREIATLDVSYGTGPNQSLSVFRPTFARPSTPVLMWVHGGTWTMGRRQQYHALGQRFASEGFVAVVVGYQTWPAANAAEQVSDVCAAVQYVIAHAQEWGGDPSRVILSGHSSGGNIAALAMLSGARCFAFAGIGGCYDAVEHFEFERRRGVERASMMSPACDPLSAHSPTLLVSPERRMGCDHVLLFHGELDNIIPLSNSALFAMALHRTGHADVELVPLPTDNHTSFLFDLGRGKECPVLLEKLKALAGFPSSRLKVLGGAPSARL